MKCRKCNGSGEIVVYEERTLNEASLITKVFGIKTKAHPSGIATCPFCEGTGRL